MPELQKLIGRVILALIPGLHKMELQQVKLRGVESGGVWIESQMFTNHILSLTGASSAPKTLVFFVPYHSISFLLDAVDEPSLSEKAFGL